MLAIKGNIRYKQCTRPQSAANVILTSHGALGRILGALLRHSSATTRGDHRAQHEHPRPVHHPPQPHLLPLAPSGPHPSPRSHQRLHLLVRLRDHRRPLRQLQQVRQQPVEVQQLLRRPQLHAMQQHRLRLPQLWRLLAVAAHPTTVRSCGGTFGSSALGSPASSFY